MIYNLNNEDQKAKAIKRFRKLLKNNKSIELKESSGKTLNQNSYLHVLIGVFAIEYGDTMEYCKKTFYKFNANKDLFLTEHINKKTGEIRPKLKSIKELSKKEIALSIERFKIYSAEMGIILPEATNKDMITEAKRQIELNKEYL